MSPTNETPKSPPEALIPLSQLARELGPGRGRRPRAAKTIRLYITKGLRGVKLRAEWDVGRWLSSHAAWEEFRRGVAAVRQRERERLAKIGEEATKAAGTLSARQRRQQERADEATRKRLIELGVWPLSDEEGRAQGPARKGRGKGK